MKVEGEYATSLRKNNDHSDCKVRMFRKMSYENKSLVEVDDQAEELNDDEKSDKSNNCDNKSNIDDSDHLVCRKVDSPLENLETLEDVEMVILGHSDIDISEVELSKIEQNNNSDTEPNNFETELMIVCD